MTLSTSSNSSSSRGVWPSLASYVVPPVAASAAIVPAFYDMVAKSALQKGLPAPRMTPMTVLQGVKGGVGPRLQLALWLAPRWFCKTW